MVAPPVPTYSYVDRVSIADRGSCPAQTERNETPPLGWPLRCVHRDGRRVAAVPRFPEIRVPGVAEAS